MLQDIILKKYDPNRLITLAYPLVSYTVWDSLNSSTGRMKPGVGKVQIETLIRINREHVKKDILYREEYTYLDFKLQEAIEILIAELQRVVKAYDDMEEYSKEVTVWDLRKKLEPEEAQI